jgi:hypothetical protein
MGLDQAAAQRRRRLLVLAGEWREKCFQYEADIIRIVTPTYKTMTLQNFGLRMALAPPPPPLGSGVALALWIEVHISVAFLAYCLCVTLQRRLYALASGKRHPLETHSNDKEAPKAACIGLRRALRLLRQSFRPGAAIFPSAAIPSAISSNGSVRDVMAAFDQRASNWTAELMSGELPDG